jgi:hypothetical protein
VVFELEGGFVSGVFRSLSAEVRRGKVAEPSNEISGNQRAAKVIWQGL